MLGTLQDIILDKEPMVADVLCCLRPEILEAVAASKDTTIPQDALTILVARRLRGD